jgi:glycosyltransferase involved in cell wall biosynthesis
MGVDVSIIIPFHSEGKLAAKTLVGLQRNLASARRAAIDVEVIAVLDSADNATRSCVELFIDRTVNSIHHVEVRDLGQARNAGIEVCLGQMALMLDGDDFLCEEFIPKAWQFSRNAGRAIWHPSTVVTFGVSRGLSFQQSSEIRGFRKSCLLRANPWNACAMAPRELFAEIPYQRSDATAKIGFEDWQWNCETIANGIPHRIVPDTAHFVRVKDRGSLNADFARIGSTFGPTKLFETQP